MCVCVCFRFGRLWAGDSLLSLWVCMGCCMSMRDLPGQPGPKSGHLKDSLWTMPVRNYSLSSVTLDPTVATRFNSKIPYTYCCVDYSNLFSHCSPTFLVDCFCDTAKIFHVGLYNSFIWAYFLPY